MYFKGKIVGDSRYIHKDTIRLIDPLEAGKIHAASMLLDEKFTWNVVKFEVREMAKISFLDYENFEESEFPALLRSSQVDVRKNTASERNHSSHNPPVLHRKELLIAPTDPHIDKYRELTRELEDLGAFSNTIKIGTKKNWDGELKALGILVQNHKVFPANLEEKSDKVGQNIARYRTAISRNALSLPAKLLFTSGLANEYDTYLDFGCGRGDDVKFLNELGISAQGWDPHFLPDEKLLISSDVVNLGFVLNVIEHKNERIKVLQRAFQLAKKCLCVAVMLNSQNSAANALPFEDGHVTSINTFQKFYDQQELEVFLRNSLHTPLIAAAPGVFLAFKDETSEQEFLLKRQLGIVQTYEPGKLKTKLNESKQATKLALNVVNNLARHILIFARKPALEELPRHFREQLKKSELSYQKAFNGASKLITEKDLEKSVARKKEQLELFFAMYLFSKRPKYGDLSPSLQKDVKLHFGSVKIIEENAKKLLFSLGDESLMFVEAKDAVRQKLGVMDGAKFNFLAKKLPDLPVRLRGIVSIAERLAGKVDGASLIRIHIDTKKVSYLCIEDFETEALPKIVRRTIVDLRQQEVRNFDHLTPGYEKVLYQKSAFMEPTEAKYEAQKRFDELLVERLDFEFAGEGPRYNEFIRELASANIQIPTF